MLVTQTTPSKARIAYIVNQYPKVSHSFIRREIRELESQGVEVIRFTIRRSPEVLADPADHEELAKTESLLEAGLAGMLSLALRVALHSPRRFLHALRMALTMGRASDRGIVVNLGYLIEACALLERLNGRQVQHLHAHFGTNAACVALLCHLLGGPPYSFTVHGPEEFERAASLALDAKIRKAAFVVAISHFCRSQLQRWCERSQWAKIHVVRCGLDESFLGNPLLPPPEDPALIYVGRLCEEKGVVLLLEAAAELKRQNVQFSLKLLGDGNLRQTLERLVIERSLQDHVCLAGWANGGEIRQHILSSRVLVLPSFAEGLPVVLMEALALARPVITTGIAGIPELVEDGISGWLLPSGSLQALRNAIKEALMATPERLFKMGLAGREVVVRRHRISVEAEKLLSLFCPRAAEEKTVRGHASAVTVTG